MSRWHVEMVNVGADVELAAWEVARSAPASQRTNAIFRAFGIADPPTIGACNAELLSLYAEQFSPELDGVACCPDCGTDVELSLDIAGLQESMAPTHPVEPLVIEGETIEWRLPVTADLSAAAAASDADQGARILLSRCTSGGSTHDGTLPGGAREALAECIAAADPYADLTLTLVCPTCTGAWETTLDIAEFVWVAMQSRARRLLREVDELARCYGWSEQQILALSQARRDNYLELVRGG
ncbi:hypothetical protein ACXYX3_14315 [Mycobacterium sp. C3-094]